MRLAPMLRSAALLALVLAASAPSGVLMARNQRSFDPIAPAPAPSAPAAPVLETRYGPVPPAMVRRAVEQLFAAWDGPQLQRLLAPDFQGKTELLQNIATEAPRDADLRLLALRQVLRVGQAVRDAAAAPGREVVDTVTATALVQVEFTDPETGAFERSQGEIELLLRIARPLVERSAGAGSSR